MGTKVRHPIFSPVPCPRSLVGSDHVLTLKAVPCWVLNFCDKPVNLFRNFSFYGVRMRTCYARPEIVYILSREDRLILRKEGFLAKLFYFYITVLTASLFPCWGLDFDFGSLYSSPVQGSLKVPFSGLSSLFVRSVTFFSTWV